jgi:hypothetical protein
MNKYVLGLALGLGMAGGVASAMTPEEALEIAIAANACGDLPIASAAFNADGAVEVVCEDDVTAFVPLGVGPVLGVVGGVLLAAIGGGGTGSTPDTQ